MKLACVVLLALVACAHDQRVRFPAAHDAPTGTLVLMFAQPASGVIVSIDGVLVLADAHTSRVVVEDVPVGTREVIVAANGADKAFRAWVASDHATTIPLGVPDSSGGFWKTLAGTLITILVYSLLHH
jgi:hypothetical protein